jgi:RimJ/RimL family protein N-acetyltransferase
MTSLTTNRLTLRLPQERDFESFAAFVARPRSKWVGGPGSREDAREGFGDNLAHWDEHGFGYFHVEITTNGEGIGRVGIRKNSRRPEPELAYSLYDNAHEGQGYATEAARAVRNWGFSAKHLRSLVSYIDPTNSPSIAVADRLGARPDGTAKGWDKHPDPIVYRHTKPLTGGLHEQ